jgi:imidazolonepropionase
MIIHSASQLLTLKGGARRGTDLADLAIIEDGAVAIEGDTIIAVGTTEEITADFPDDLQISASGCAVMPGLVDPHTHLVWAGERAAEFEMRIQGITYMEIMEAGGGILGTVNDTRNASLDELVQQTQARALCLFASGVTTAEVKSGYGLDTVTELRQLEAIYRLNETIPMEMVPTFLGAHAVPPEYNGDIEGYTRLVCEEMLPAVQVWYQQHFEPLPFVDVFCEAGVFNLAQTSQILTEAQSMGFPLKVHADEFENLGAAGVAIDLGAASVDHLVKTSQQEIQQLANSETIAVALPCTPFGLADSHYTPARQIIEAGGLLAVATDSNPGPAWCESMQFVIALSCRYLRLTPAEAVAAATINAAAAIQREGRIGSLEPGKQADLLILEVDDYRHLGYRFGGNLVKTIIKKGIQYFPGTMRRGDEKKYQ